MNCRGVIQELSDYLDGDLDAQAKADLERHLKNCEDCRLVVDTTRQTIRIFCNSEPLPLPVEIHDRLHAALAKRLSKRQS